MAGACSSVEALLNTRQTTATASESGAGVIVVGRLGHTIATRAGLSSVARVNQTDETPWALSPVMS